MNDASCGTCTWWERRNTRYGNCLRLSHDAAQYVVLGEPVPAGNRLEAFTLEEFACPFWHASEPDGDADNADDPNFGVPR
jgi:hypothetical protein